MRRSNRVWRFRLLSRDRESEDNVQSLEQQIKQINYAYLRIAPTGTQAEQVVFSYFRLLNNTKVITESRVEWLWQVSELIRDLNEKPDDERMRLLNLLADSKNPILQVYGELAKARL